MSGSKCVRESQYHSQCVPDPSCIANNKPSGSSGPAGCCSGTVEIAFLLRLKSALTPFKRNAGFKHLQPIQCF